MRARKIFWDTRHPGPINEAKNNKIFAAANIPLNIATSERVHKMGVRNVSALFAEPTYEDSNMEPKYDKKSKKEPR